MVNTAGSSKLVSSGPHELTQANTATNVSLLVAFCMLGLYDACCMPSPFNSLCHARDKFHQAPLFLCENTDRSLGMSLWHSSYSCT